jgi:hypothetical protein
MLAIIGNRAINGFGNSWLKSFQSERIPSQQDGQNRADLARARSFCHESSKAGSVLSDRYVHAKHFIVRKSFSCLARLKKQEL